MRKLLLLSYLLILNSALGMEGFLKQSTAVNVTVALVDSADHVTGKTGLTLTIFASKAAGAPASISPTVTELDSTNAKGVYKLALTTAHTDTLGELLLHISATGADMTDYKWQVSTYLPGEAATLQADQAVNTTKVGGTTQTARDLGASVLLSSGTGTGQISLTSGAVTVGTNNDKAGYSLSQSFPTNFSSFSIDANGRVDVIKVNGTSQTARDLGAQLDATVSSRLASASYTAPPSAASIATTIFQDLTSGSDFTTANSIGKLFADNINATISSRSTYAGGDTSGTTTLLARLTATRAGLLDHLDADISSRSTYAGADTSGVTTLLSRIGSALTITGGKVDINDKTGFSLISAYDPAKVDPLSVTLPGSYTGQTAGNLIWRVGNKP